MGALKLFGMINFAERAGTGVSGIYAAWEKEGWKAPILEEQFNPDRTVLSLVLSKTSDKKRAIKTSNDAKTSKSDSRKQAIIEYLTANKIGKTSEISENIGVSPGRVRVYLQEMVTDGVVAEEGANRNRTYRLKE